MITYAVPGLLIPTKTATCWSPPVGGRCCRGCAGGPWLCAVNLRRFPAPCTVHTQRLCSLFYLTIGPTIATHTDERLSNQAGGGGMPSCGGRGRRCSVLVFFFKHISEKYFCVFYNYLWFFFNLNVRSGCSAYSGAALATVRRALMLTTVWLFFSPALRF